MDMKELKKAIGAYVDAHAQEYIDLANSIWEYAELSLKEYKSAALFIELLKKEGFTVRENLCGIATAFSGSYGAGAPHIGILGEFDALSGLSQKAGALEREELVKNGSGHGCGHNLLGAGSFAAACAVKDFLKKTGLPGTVTFYGCPGEEGGASKAYMARDWLWKELDCALSWHPGDTNELMTGTNNSCTQVLYKFKGVAAHAASNPYEGRSALDAVELMNVGVQYLREHMPPQGRIHYAMVDGGGLSPNVVQPHASVLYMVRSQRVKDTLELQRRVDLIAQGAAMMTETTYERIFVDGTADLLPNTALEKVLHDNMLSTDLPAYTKEEWAFAESLKKTFPPADELPGDAPKWSEEIKAFVKKTTDNGKRAINDFVMPFLSSNEFTPGSTDVGDVSWLTPTAEITAAAWPSGSPGHSWQNVSCGATSLADKGMLYAAKVLAGAAADLFADTGLIDKAKAEFARRTEDGGYVCPIPADAVPYVIEE